MNAPADIRPELAERFRQLRPFDEAEVALVQALVKRPGRLDPEHEQVLRRALNLARLWILPTPGGEVPVGPHLGGFRERARRFAMGLPPGGAIDPERLGSDAAQLRPLLADAQGQLLREFYGHVRLDDLDRELSQKALVLALGGGGGCGYVHLGAFSLLESLKLRPRLIAGASMGAILGMFRSRDGDFHENTLRAVTHGLSFKKIFRVLDAETRYAMPGALRLYLRTALSRFFLNEDGQTMTLDQLAIPLLVQATGVRREAARRVAKYERLFRQRLRFGPIGRLLHVRDLVTGGVKFLSELLATPGALRSITLGGDDATRTFDAIDAAGFSAALPAVIQYDITRNDIRMRGLVESVLHKHGVDFLADGGLSANVPAQAAWEYVQSGRLGTRNACVVGLDCFAPHLGRNVVFLPLQRLAAETVAKNRPFAQVMFDYRWTLAPTSVVPSFRAMQAAVHSGREELRRVAPLLRKLVEPLPPIGVTSPSP